MKAESWLHCRIQNRLRKSAVLCTLAFVFTAFGLFQSVPTAFADTPAVTDFGQIDAAPVLTNQMLAKQAVFLTLYPDGKSHSEVRGVTDDGENAMVSDHPSWKLDHSLTWFVQMPVYVRNLSTKDVTVGTSSV